MGEWTLDELVQRVAHALSADGVRAPNARVTAVPDGRIIRWYATIGLVDRPHVGRGRTARYGPRHLLQLVAIKRRQAQGCSLAEIQAELTGAPDAMLRRVAAVPAELLEAMAGTDATAQAGDQTRRSAGAFWAKRPASPSEPDPSDPANPSEPHPSGPAEPLPGRPAIQLAAAAPGDGAAAAARPRASEPDTVLCGVRLAGDTVLLLPRVPPERDVPAIQAAAAPLLELLAERGLLAGATGGDQANRGESRWRTAEEAQ
jgi:DNA-binding transcriptional MerR regulator